MLTVKTWVHACILGLSAGVAIIVHAADGVLEINQDCATRDGCFADDTGGFPITITQPGSYLLTGTLQITDPDIDGIIIDAPDVTLDLNGFAIRGPVVCEGTPTITSCSPSGSNSTAGRGITVGSDASATLKNGVVRGMDLEGISCFNNTTCLIEGIRAVSNGRDGLVVTGALGNGHVRNSFAIRNGRHGISGQPRLVSATVVRGNAVNGMDIADTVLRTNNAFRNGEDGIECTNDCLLKDNILSENGNSGVQFITGGSAYGHNSFLSNSEGSVDGVATSIDTNLCDTTTCP